MLLCSFKVRTKSVLARQGNAAEIQAYLEKMTDVMKQVSVSFWHLPKFEANLGICLSLKRVKQ